MPRGHQWTSTPDRCAVDGCPNGPLDHLSRGRWLCGTHKARLLTHGDVLAEVPIGPLPQTCSVVGCSSTFVARNDRTRCEAHRRRTQLRECSLPGCAELTGIDAHGHQRRRCERHRQLARSVAR